MENIVSISDDPNNQLAFVQQLVSQLSVAGNPVTINVVQTQQNVQGDIFYNGNSSNDNNNNNDNSNNIVTKEYFDEKVAILSEASTDLDKKVAILSEALSDLDKKVANLSEALTNVKSNIKAGQTQRVVEYLSAVTTKLLAGQVQLITGINDGIVELTAGQAGLIAGVVNLSESLTDVKAEQTQLVAGITAGINKLLAGQNQTVAGMNLEVQAGIAGLKHARSAMDSFVNEIKR
ncbi:hypothetical protein FRACYDRAFT_246410 [Fragilariopsis cylindrus CCMP1102]|uniref:Uncharacterized protein n=1 Tax=Fragilariopsis cylindrus CCMP1102 TaxID=635003 RepID=A0A1E7EZL8_9STRA|nr:hypothetical protein FRACYDRAFT_246410 [Fragilariopsis cylindrus CCMP1102]|eukprot:OEU11296.1 hypothetical protein FRACYDRAFT_246410 [Fragilariopsis cylindrus CCMP1102]